MPTEEYKKAYIFLSSKCSKKEISSREALKACSKFKLKIVEKNNLINELKKQNFINHERFSKAFVHDRFNFYRWGKNKIIHHLQQQGIEEFYITIFQNSQILEAFNLVSRLFFKIRMDTTL